MAQIKVQPRAESSFGFFLVRRAWDHELKADKTKKGQRIAQILAEDGRVQAEVLVDDLQETQALKIEAELIAAYGTEDTGGLLTNSVVPSGVVNRASRRVAVPSGSVEKAQLGLGMIRGAIMALALANEQGITNADAARSLGLQSDYRGGSKDYLSFSVLGLLMREGRITREKGSRLYRAWEVSSGSSETE